MGFREMMDEIADTLKALVGHHGREAQRERWKLRRKDRFFRTGSVRAVKATKKGAGKGAFGRCRGPFDYSKAFTPTQMRELQAKLVT